MGVYVCNVKHLEVLVSFAVHAGVIHREDALQVARKMFDCNIHGVANRYPDLFFHQLPGQGNLPAVILDVDLESYAKSGLRGIDIFKMADCMEHQSAGASGLASSGTGTILSSIRQRAVNAVDFMAVRESAEYRSATWSYSEPEAPEVGVIDEASADGFRCAS